MTMNPTHAGAIPGAGIDADPGQRPGVPMEKDPPEPVGAAHWGQPIRQPDPGYILKRRGLEKLTPVFGTSVPPRGISGLMRRAAYAIPDHRTTHWLVLLLADRIDVLEDRAKRVAPLLLPLLIGGGALLYTARRRRTFMQRLMCRLG
jgi:hypothetical protein